MHMVTTIGLDIAKSVFQVHGIDTTGNVIIRPLLKRRHVLTFFRDGCDSSSGIPFWICPCALF
jgi:hypothetical protein